LIVTEVLNQKRSTVVALLVAAAMAFTSVNAIAADYPPSLEQLVVGQPIITPVPPQTKGCPVVVPVATSNQLPILRGEQITAYKADLAPKVLTIRSVATTPVQITSLVVLGGIAFNDKAPLATVPRRTCSEIQIPVDAPTRINVTGFKPGALVTASFINRFGKSVALGKVVVTKAGVVPIPALTFARKDTVYKIRLTINNIQNTTIIRTRG